MEKLDPLKSKMSEHHFSEAHFEKSLSGLKNTQESIAGLSSWCLQHKQHHKKIVTCWFKIMKKATIENRLILFYLANDVIQYSKRKNYDYVNTWALFLQRSVTLVRDDKVKGNISRIFKIWGERGIYDETFIADLNGLLDCPKGVSSDTAKLVAEFQPLRLVDKIRGCKLLEDDTDLRLKHIKDYPLDLTNADTLRSSLKDRRHGADLVSEVDQGMVKIQSYVTSLKEEIKERAKLIELLEQGDVFYQHQRGEAKIVVTAYKNFGLKVKKLLKAAEEKLPSLSSPVPSPDVNAPSPSGSDDLQLPDTQEPKFSVDAYAAGPNPFMQGGMGGSFIGSGISFDFQTFNENAARSSGPMNNGLSHASNENKHIEVIGSSSNSKKPDDGFNINDFIKCLNPANTPPPPLPVPAVQSPRMQHKMHPPPMPNMPPPQISNILMNFSAPPPPPPPEAPGKFEHTQEYNKWNNFNRPVEWEPKKNMHSWPPPNAEHDIDWSGPEKKMRFDEAPRSPPMFEKEGFNQPVQFDDRTGVVLEDVDHRAARLKKDIDHRNLISLTGSASAISNSSRKNEQDSDMRFIPPLLSKKIDLPSGLMLKSGINEMDESIDMELSDDELDPCRRKKGDSLKRPLLPTPDGGNAEVEWNPPPPGAEEEANNLAKPMQMMEHVEGMQDLPPDVANRLGQHGEFFGPLGEMLVPPPMGGFGGPAGLGGAPPQFRPQRASYGKYNPGYTPGFTNRVAAPAPPMMRGGPPPPQRFRGPSPVRPFRGRGRAHFARW